MEKTSFFNHIRDTFAFKNNEILDSNKNFKEHWNWSSMTSLLTLSMFFSEYDAHVSADELIMCKTFEDLYKLVNSKVEDTCITP